jgi:glycosyltransferase involved in cell wall biosynthesis
MRSLDVFSHTAVQPEPFGLVLLEAMAASRPVVASKAGGPLEIVREAETGMLAEPGSARAHADCLCSLLRDPARRESMGREGRLRVESQFSAATFARRLHAIYADIESVKGASGSPAD